MVDEAGVDGVGMGDEEVVSEPAVEAKKNDGVAQGGDELGVEGGVADVMREEIEGLRAKLQDAEVELVQSRQTITDLERRERIGRALAAVDAVDVEVAGILTELAVGEMDEPDIEGAVAELRRKKPYLFGRAGMGGVGGGGGSAMSARVRGVVGEVDDAARRAVLSGDRRDLLAYMRKRRPRPQK